MLDPLDKNLMSSLSCLIAVKRKEKNWSAEELAKVAKLPVSQIVSLESGEKDFGLEVLYELAQAFDVSIFDLLIEAEQINSN